MNQTSAFFALTRYTLGRMLSPGRLTINVIIFAVPVLMATGFAMGGRRQVDLIAGSVMVYFNLYLVLIAASIYNSLALTSAELEDGSALTIYGGVLPRWLVLLNRYFVGVLVLATGSTLSMLVIYLILSPMGLRLDTVQIVRFAGIGAMGVAAYVAVYMACGAWFRHSMAASIILTVLWEVVVFGTPTKLWPFTVTCSLRAMVKTLVYDGKPPQWLLRVSDNLKTRGIEMLSPAEAMTFLSILAIAALLIGAWAISRRQLTDRAASE